MNKLIDIGTNILGGDNEVFTGDNFEKFLRNLPPMGPEELSRIKNSTINILSQCVGSGFIKPSYEQNTGLVLGYIQSGKTMSFTSLIALASDNKYKVIILFAGTTTILLNQTVERLREDLSDKNEYVIIQEAGIDQVSTISSIIKNKERERIVILPILKQWQHIEKLQELFNSPQLNIFLPNKGILIIDDEADQASLNGFARRNYKLSKKKDFGAINDDDEKSAFKFSTTYDRISNLKSSIPNHSYIQYTATPQANLLLGQRDLLRPSWCEVLEPGDRYTGGKRFFNHELDLIQVIEKENVNNLEEPEMPENLRHAFRLFLIESALLCYDFDKKKRIKEKIKLTSMMIHADRLIKVNNFYVRWLKSYKVNIIQDLNNSEEEVIENFKEVFDDVKIKLAKYFVDFPSFKQVIKKIKYYVLEETQFWFVAGKEDSEVDWKRCDHHVLVGGQKLDRGFTVKNLVVTYMPRSTKSKSNADTIEQRCRFFGYKKDYIDSCRVYLPQDSVNEFEEYVHFEKHLRDFLKRYPIDEFYDNDRLMKFGVLNPTSQNKIPGELFRNDFRSFNYFQPDFKNSIYNDRLINFFLKSSKEIGVLEPKNNNSKDNKHKLYKSTIGRTKELLLEVKFNSKREQLAKAQLLDLLEKIDINQKTWVIQIAHERNRPRSLKSDGRIKSLASNYPPTFGDRDLLIKANDLHNFYRQYNNEPIIQIHKIKIKDNASYPENIKKHIGLTLNVIAVVLPNEKSSSSFISVDYD